MRPDGTIMNRIFADVKTTAPHLRISNPKPFVITDRADVTPDQVDIRVIGNEVSFSRTNSGFNGAIPPDDFTGNGPGEN